MHVHVSPLEFIQYAAFLVIFGFLWRSLAAYWSNNKVGQAMAFIY